MLINIIKFLIATLQKCGNSVFAIFVLLWFVTNPLQVVAQHYMPLDKGSKITFSILQSQEKGLKIKGTIGNIKGKINFDPKHLDKSSIDVSAGAASAHTTDKSDDFKLKSADYFDCQKYPLIKITSTKIKQDRPGGAVYILTGNLTIKGITKPVSFQFMATPAAKGMMFRGMMHFNRKDFKLGPDGELPKDVTVFFEVMARKA